MVRCLRFMSRQDVLRFAPLPGSALISIHDRSEPALQFDDPWGPVLQLRFHDTQPGTLGLELFSVDHAKRVLAFAEQHGASSPELIVHCHAGNSRSAAIALFLASQYGVKCLRDGIPQLLERHMLYNRYVYRVLELTARGLPVDVY